MATHSGTLAWEIRWTEEHGGLQSMGLQRVRCDWVCMHCPWEISFGGDRTAWVTVWSWRQMPSQGEGTARDGQPVFATPWFPLCCPLPRSSNVSRIAWAFHSKFLLDDSCRWPIDSSSLKINLSFISLSFSPWNIYLENYSDICS